MHPSMRGLTRIAVGLLAAGLATSVAAPAMAAVPGAASPNRPVAGAPAADSAAATSAALVAGPFTRPVGGYLPSPNRVAAHSATGTAYAAAASVDLRADAPAPGDQGQIGACVSWTVAHDLMGYYAAKTGGSGAPYAPLYLYMRTVGSGAPSAGTVPEKALTEAQNNGVDTQDDYYQGTTNWQVAPTAAQIANAANYKAVGWQTLWSGANQGDAARSAVQNAISAGNPVAIGFQVYQDFMSLHSDALYNTLSGSSLGGHMVAIFGYDEAGVWIRNSWSANWGANGDAHLSWAFVNKLVQGAYTIAGVQTPANTVVVAPTVAALSPRTGTTTGGGTVTITGSGLSSATGVKFGDASAEFTSAVNNGTTTLTATVPARSTAGTVPVTVTSEAGTSTVTTATTFTYTLPKPAVTGLEPSSVTILGGTTVTVTGTDLAGTTSVKVGGTSVKFTQVSPTSVQFASPKRTPATVDVVVTTGGGVSATGDASRLTFTNPAAPAVTEVSPTSGLTYLTTPVTLTGTFAGVTGVTVDGKKVSFAKLSDTQLKVTMPVHAAGAVSVAVTNAGGTGEATFTYVAPDKPAVTEVSPATGATYLTTPVTLTGTTFVAVSGVTLNGAKLAYKRVNDQTITVTMPKHDAGEVALAVTTPGGTSDAATFTYVKPDKPAVTEVSPATGPTYATTPVTLTGTTFVAVSGVTLNGAKLAYKRVNDQTITVTMPKHDAGEVALAVTTPGGTSDAATFTYIKPDAPVISSLSAASGPSWSTTAVTLTGTTFINVTSVTIDGTKVSAKVVNTQTITVTMPKHAAGEVTLKVTAAGGTSEGVTFTYNAPPTPVITKLSATSAPAGKPVVLTVTGTGFLTVSKVLANGTAVTFKSAGDGKLTVTLPATLSGAVDLQVVALGGTSEVTDTARFTLTVATTASASRHAG